MQCQCVRYRCRAGNFHERMCKIGRKQFAASQNEGGRAVRVGSNVKYIKWFVNHFCLGISLKLDGFLEHRKFIIYAISVRGQCKTCEATAWDLILVHVTPHDERGL